MNLKRTVQVFLLLFAVSVSAQEEVIDDKKGINFIVTGGGKVSYEKGKKISDEPKFVDTVKVKLNVKYSTVDKKVEKDFKVETINPPKLVIMEPLEKLYKGVFEIGVNDFKTPPYARFNYSTVRNKEYNAGIYLKHFSSDLKVKDVAATRFTESNAGLYGKKFYKKHTAYAGVDYNYNTFRNYGYSPVLFSLAEEDNQLYYSLLNANIGIENSSDDEVKTHYSIEFNYDQLMAKYEVAEHLMDLKYTLKGYNLFKGTPVDSIFPESKYTRIWQLDASVKHLLSNDSANFVESTLFEIGGMYKVKSNNFNMELAVPSVTFLTNKNRQLLWTPKVNLDYAIAEKILIAYAALDRKLQRNYYMTYFANNPFVGADLPHTNTLINYDVSLGLKGALSSKTTFNVGARHKDVKDFVLFVNNPSSIGGRKFTVITDDVMHSQFFGELVFETKKIKSGLLASYNIYEVATTEAFHLPEIEGQAYIRYNVQDKFSLGGDLFYYGEQTALDALGAIINLKPIVDFSVSIDYHYSKKIGAFLKVNNVLSTNHQRWNQYPNYGINVLGGLSISF